MANRVLLVGLSLAVAGGVALAAWARRGGESGRPSAPPVAAAAPAVPVAEWVDLGDDPPPSGDRERIDPPIDPETRKSLERMNWCGTGVVDGLGGDVDLPPLVDDDSIRVRVTHDHAWNALLAALPGTDLAVDRLALVRAFLLERAKSAPRADLAALARDLARIERNQKLERRLSLAADALVESADDAWKAYLEPPPPPPPPSSARPPGR